MNKKLYITLILSDDPRTACLPFLKNSAAPGFSALVLTRSSYRADYYKRRSVEINNGRVSPGLNCISFNSFIENYSAHDLDSHYEFIDYEQKKLLLIKAAAHSKPEIKIEDKLIDSLSESIGELKSNNIDLNFLKKLKKYEAYKNLSLKCRRLFELYERYQHILSDGGFYDYHDRAAALSYDEKFHEFIKKTYEWIIFDRLENISPVEIDLLGSAAAACKKISVIISKTAGEINPQELTFKRVVKRIESIGFAVEIETAPAEDADPAAVKTPCVKCEKYFNALKTSSLKKGFIHEIKCADTASEAEQIARAIASLALKENTPLHKTAIFMPRFTAARKLFKTAFDKYGLKFQTNESKKLSEFSIIQKLSCILKFIASGDYDSFTPLFNLRIFKRFAEFKKFSVSAQMLKKVLLITKIFGPGRELASGEAETAILLESGRDAETAALMLALYRQIKEFKESKENIFNNDRLSILECYNRLERLISGECFIIGDGPEFDLFSFAASNLRQYAFAAAGMGVSEKLSVREAVLLLRDRLFQLFAPDSCDGSKLKDGGKPGAVIIHSRENINLFEYDYIFIAGAIEGVFPAHEDRHSLFMDNSDREILNFYSQPQALHSSRCLFHQLLASPQRGVFLSAPASNLNSPLMKSRFISEVENAEEYIADDSILCAADLFKTLAPRGIAAEDLNAAASIFDMEPAALSCAVDEIRRAEKVLAARDTLFKSDFLLDCSKIKRDFLLGRLYKSFERKTLKVSPTLIEKFYYCPARYFFSETLGLKEDLAYSGELEPLNEGEIIHKTLELFFGGADVIKILYDYFHNPNGRTAAREFLESLLLKAGIAAMEHYKIKSRFGEAYYKIKSLQYFNALEDFERNRPGAKASYGINGYFKNFITDYLDNLAAQDFYAAPAAVEYALRSELKDDGLEIELHAKCDRIDICADKENNRIYFIITDYKTGAVPAAKEINSYQKIQAPFYLYFLKDQFDAFVKAGKPALGFKAESAQAAGFIYTSISKLDDKLRPKKLVFISNQFLAPRARKSQTAECGGEEPDGGFKLKLPCGAFANYEQLISAVPGIIKNFILKTAGGDFHASILPGHSCDYCEFKRICHRSARAAAASDALNRSSENIINNGEPFSRGMQSGKSPDGRCI